MPQNNDLQKEAEPRSQLPPNHGFTLFTRHLIFTQMFKALNSSEKDRQLSIRWEKLSEQEKSEYNIEAEKVFKKTFPVV